MSENWPYDVMAEKDTRIAELEAENHELTLRLNDQRTTAAELRKVAYEAEAALVEANHIIEVLREVLGKIFKVLLDRDLWDGTWAARAEEGSGK